MPDDRTRNGKAKQSFVGISLLAYYSSGGVGHGLTMEVNFKSARWGIITRMQSI